MDGEFEERYRAIFSRSAHGYPYKDLQINYSDGMHESLCTRLLFLNVSIEEAMYLIVPHIPVALDLNISDHMGSLTRAEFFDKDHVERILHLQDYDFRNLE